MKYFLDVNVLIAWGWEDHPHNLRVRKWIGSSLKTEGMILHTSSIPEIGFVRVSLQKTIPQISVHEATTALRNLLSQMKGHHRFLPDDLSSCREFPPWCSKAKHTTDAHLFALAEKHGLKLATLDTGIPGAYLIPS